ncbi:nuclear transport factor 2 family protein [Pseudarthrobacter sp. S9]|uniref:nuclear transport factor 2 family protein n=1 Tax=Pseudarthrobacter sp. S9 TaxID=3418421 RepID=UPI003CFD34C5
MGTTENAELVRRGYEAFIAGDMATLSEIFAEDAVWHAAGSGVLSGTKQGRDAILAYFGELGTRSEGTLEVTVQDIVGGEKHTVALQHNHAETNGKIMDLDGALAFEVRDGRITAGREFFEDTAKGDEFWA